MTMPLPPVVHGPITDITPEARVSGALAGAVVTLLARQGAARTVLGQATAGAPGEVWVKFTGKPVVGSDVVAVQKVGGDESEPSPQPVLVTETPTPLATPVVVSQLNTCMADVLVDGLTPGATVVAAMGGAQMTKRTATRTAQWIGLDPNAPIAQGAVLEVHQEATLAGQAVASAVATSLPIASLGLELLPPPVIAPPLGACRREIDVALATPGAILRIDNAGMSERTVAPVASFSALGFPLQQGALVASQTMPRCNLTSKNATYTVDPPSAPPAPVATQDVCPQVPCFVASNLVPGATLVVARLVDPPGGARQIGAGREFGVGATTETIYLGFKGMETTDPAGPVSFQVHQKLCGVAGPSIEIAVRNPGGPAVAPKVREPVYACARALRIENARPGAWIQAFDGATNLPLCDVALAPATELLLKLWFPAMEGRTVFVRQTGCDADGQSHAVVVQKVPAKLPVPKIEAPVRPSANAIRLSGVLPGARVFVLVDGAVRAEADCWSETPTIYLSGPALKENQKLFAMQALCDRWSDKEGPGVVVARGKMNVSVSPAGAIPRGVASQIVVQATDADTHAPVALAQVFLKGQHVGTSGLAFDYTPASSEPTPLSGEVREDVAYHPAPFQIALTDPNWIMRNIAAPTSHLVDGSLQVTIEEATWVITPDWDPGLTRKIVKPPTPPNIYVDTQWPAPTGAVKTVQVRLESLKCSTPGGFAFTYMFYPGEFPGIGDVATVAWAGKNIKISWLIAIETPIGKNGQPYLRPRAKVSSIVEY